MVVTRLMASRRAREGHEDGLSPTRNVEAMIWRTPPHLLNECKRKHLNMEVSRNVEEMTRRTPPHLLNEHNKKPFNMIESMNVDAMNRRTPPHLLNQHNRKPFNMTESMNVDAMTWRAPPHLLNKHNRGHFNTKESAFTSHAIGSSSINHTRTRNGNYAHFGFRPISIGGSSSLPQNHSMYTGIVPEKGQTQGYLYLPALLSAIPNASATSCSLHKEGTPLANDNPSEHPRSSLGGKKLGGSSSRSAEYQLPHQFSSFYPVVLHTNGNNNWNHSQNQQLPQYHYYQLGREEQLPLPSYWSSQNTSDISNSACARATSSSVLGKRPAASSKPVHSFFQPPPPLPLLDADDIEPQCRLETDELLSLMQSLGTPEFLSNAEKVLRSGSSLYEPHHATPANVTTGNSRAASAPSLVLGMGNGGADDKGKGKQVCLYWDLSDMVEMMESMKKKRLETSQSLPKLTLGSDGQGCSKDTMQRRLWNRLVTGD